MLTKHIAFDLDDVILDFVGGLRAAIKTEQGIEIPDSAITDFNLAPFLDPILGESWWSWLRRRDWLWPNFPAVNGAIGTLERLKREGYYLEIITSKPEWADYAVWKWLGKWRPAVRRVTIVRVGDNKAAESDAPILVDDKMQNCDEWVQYTDYDQYGNSHNIREALLFTRPHNRLEIVPQRIHRVNNWQEVYKKIKELTNA